MTAQNTALILNNLFKTIQKTPVITAYHMELFLTVIDQSTDVRPARLTARSTS